MIKPLILSLTLLPILSLAECNEIYLKTGAGYKFEETKNFKNAQGTKFFIDSEPISARLELGLECEAITFGVSHHSQWLQGWPVDDRGEYNKTEIFIDYKFSWGI